jgi:hypothetical protein
VISVDIKPIVPRSMSAAIAPATRFRLRDIAKGSVVVKGTVVMKEPVVMMGTVVVKGTAVIKGTVVVRCGLKAFAPHRLPPKC